VLAVGAVLATVGVRAQRTLPLRADLAGTVPREFEGYAARDLQLSREEAQVAGVSDYLVRVFEDTGHDTTRARSVSLYVGYYDRQTRGKTIHSPKNCLPGAGWEPLTSQTAEVATPAGTVRVNRYLLQRGAERALVLYWYQGRGRVAWNEYAVKWDLLRDAALLRRSDEALVRIVVPMRTTEADALAHALRLAQRVLPAVTAALPA
jgi:EpsI family protein